MKSQSGHIQDLVVYYNSGWLIHYNTVQLTREDGFTGQTITSYECDEVWVKKDTTKQEIIDTITAEGEGLESAIQIADQAWEMIQTL